MSPPRPAPGLRALTAVLLVPMACAGRNDTGDCDSTEGSISGTVYEDYPWDELDIAPAGVAKVVIRQGELEPITALSDEDSHYSLSIDAGHWTLEAFTQDDSCASMENYEVDLQACRSISLDLLIETCVL